MECMLCDIAKGRTGVKIVLHTAFLTAYIPKRPAVPGHVVVIPNEHYTIFEQIPDDVTKQVFMFINEISSAVLESTNAQGLNIVVNNGVCAGQTDAHFSVNIIPRYEGDGLDYSWKPDKNIDLNSVETALNADPEKEIINNDNTGNDTKKTDDTTLDEGEDVDYLIKGIQRLP